MQHGLVPASLASSGFRVLRQSRGLVVAVKLKQDLRAVVWDANLPIHSKEWCCCCRHRQPGPCPAASPEDLYSGRKKPCFIRGSIPFELVAYSR